MSAEKPDPSQLACPAPILEHSTVQLAHGGGGRLSQRLVEGLILPAFDNPALRALHDGALVTVGGQRLAFSTDSFVVRPLFFPGGDIGSLAVHGTVNDLLMCGAKPLALSAGFILEEGFAIETLSQVVESMRRAAERAGVSIVTGDTKVVDRGKGDGIYVNTAGIGLVAPGLDISPARARVGDRVLVSGTLGDHGIAVMSVREGLRFETDVLSDSAALDGLLEPLFSELGPELHVLRDPTRGGLASALNEIAASAELGVHLEEQAIPVRDAVRGACEILGLDPLYVANEGKCVLLVAPAAAARALELLRAHPLGRNAALIGEVVAEHAKRVVLRSRIGAQRIVDMLSGEQLPRIC